MRWLAPLIAILALALIGSRALAADAPAVGTGIAREITSTSAAVTGAIGAGGQVTTYAFQYGTTTQYPDQTAVYSVDPTITYASVSATLTGLHSGTRYHFRVIAANASGTTAGHDVTFVTGGPAPPLGIPPVAVTTAATAVHAHDAVLTGMLNPAGSNVRYYFQFGTRQPYEFQTISEFLPAGLARSVEAPVSGLQSNQIFHYRLVAVNEHGDVSAGSDHAFLTVPSGRVNPSAIEVSVSPVSQRRLPDTVTVSGRLVPPPSLPRAVACLGFVDITFRVRRIAIDLRRAGIHADCRFETRVRFSIRRRLLGGHVNVEVLFSGNEILHRRAAPTRTIQIG